MEYISSTLRGTVAMFLLKIRTDFGSDMYLSDKVGHPSLPLEQLRNCRKSVRGVSGKRSNVVEFFVGAAS